MGGFNQFNVNFRFCFGSRAMSLDASVHLYGNRRDHYGNRKDQWRISAGIRSGNNFIAGGGGVSRNDFGLSYHLTRFGNDIGPDGYSNMQDVGEIGVQMRWGTARLANDFLANQGRDRWRSNAIEIGLNLDGVRALRPLSDALQQANLGRPLSMGELTIGTFVYNNDPAGENPEIEGHGTFEDANDPLALSRRGRPNISLLQNIIPSLYGNKYTAWKNGKTYISPLYIGFRNGGFALRWGYSHPVFQDATQNFVHREGFLFLPFGFQNYFNDYSEFRRGWYVCFGYNNNPFSLYRR